MARVRFSDVVKRVNVFVDREQTDLLYYVGGEHIDSDTFMVRKKGLIKGATIGYKFHFGFQPGHILFMSRNPHLRKCSMVDFAGVCSDSTYVVETRDENVLLQKYLLIEMQSDRFWKWAEENKSGSVNYLINYCTLDSYEFDLPPIEEQRALAEKLWAANDLKEKYQNLLAATDEMLKAKFREMFGECGGQSAEGGVREIGLLEIGECKNGLNFSPNETGAMIKCVGVSDFGSKTSLIDFSEVADLSVSNLPSQEYWLQDNDFLFVRSNGNKDLVGRCMLIKPGDVRSTFGGFCIRYRLHDKAVLHKWLLYWFRSEEIRRRLQGRSGNGSINNLSQSILAEINVPIPPIELQRKFVAIANAAEASKAELKKSIASIDAVMRGLING